MRKLKLHKKPKKFLNNLVKSDKSSLKLILQKIELLKIEPLPPGSKKMINYRNCYRVRSGNYRIIYEFNKDLLDIIVINQRGKAYKTLQ